MSLAIVCTSIGRSEIKIIQESNSLPIPYQFKRLGLMTSELNKKKLIKYLPPTKFPWRKKNLNNNKRRRNNLFIYLCNSIRHHLVIPTNKPCQIQQKKNNKNIISTYTQSINLIFLFFLFSFEFSIKLLISIIMFCVLNIKSYFQRAPFNSNQRQSTWNSKPEI